MIFIGINEGDEQKEIYTFKVLGGKSPDDDEEAEDEHDEQEDDQ